MKQLQNVLKNENTDKIQRTTVRRGKDLNKDLIHNRSLRRAYAALLRIEARLATYQTKADSYPKQSALYATATLVIKELEVYQSELTAIVTMLKGA